MNLVEARVSDEVHPHKLAWDPSRKAYHCFICKEKSNHAPSYKCPPCNLHFHGDCATPLVRLYHPFHTKTELKHSPMSMLDDQKDGNRKVCTACNYLIRRAGHVHSNSTKNLYFHPCCAVLPESVPEMKMVLLRDAADVLRGNICGICHASFNGGWVYLFEATGYCAHVWCVLVEQGHAISLVNTHPFEVPTMNCKTIDWNQRRVPVPQGIPLHEIHCWRPPHNYHQGQYVQPFHNPTWAGQYNGGNYFHSPMHPAHNQHYYDHGQAPQQGSPAYSYTAPWPSPQHGGAGPSSGQHDRPFHMFGTILKWGFKIAVLAVGIAGIAGA